MPWSDLLRSVRCLKCISSYLDISDKRSLSCTGSGTRNALHQCNHWCLVVDNSDRSVQCYADAYDFKEVHNDGLFRSLLSSFQPVNAMVVLKNGILRNFAHLQPQLRKQCRLWLDKLHLQYLGSKVGWGLFSTSAVIPSGTLLLPYYGEYISSRDTEHRHLLTQTVNRQRRHTEVCDSKRIRSNSIVSTTTVDMDDSVTTIDIDQPYQMNYILTIKEHIPATESTLAGVLVSNVDAAVYGSVSRFVNHSCNPNMAIRMIRPAVATTTTATTTTTINTSNRTIACTTASDDDDDDDDDDDGGSSSSSMLVGIPVMQTIRTVAPGEQLSIDYYRTEILVDSDSDSDMDAEIDKYKDADIAVRAVDTQKTLSTTTTASSSSSSSSSIQVHACSTNLNTKAGRKRKKLDPTNAIYTSSSVTDDRNGRKCYCGSFNCRRFLPNK